ncbi:hypothetical protein CDLVIII_2409 [Clostridium sp. DL-VIII]|uniref:ABC-three component system middle component 1 n=1 Tax=Clostridium sp. DL-VIII TaxID=641107 RepID=UPI00023AFE88|nr:ABC-three component system middle component 1 [Clostridium sp. DL-VIII]EHI99055.1 hypothetical protein CDLVIII_2409 [Clostridium sp. DL-VIII]
MLQIDRSKLKLLEESDMFQIYSNLSLKCWISNKDGFNIYIYTITVEDEAKLNEIWEAFVSDIAVYVQSELTKNIEVWNIYTIFFVKKKIGYSIKYKIEEDRYSTRKIVIDNYDNEQYSKKSEENIINEKLFDFTIQTQEQYVEENMNNKDLLLSNDPDLYKIVSGKPIENIKEALAKYSGVEL